MHHSHEREAVDAIRRFKSASPALQRMIDADLAGYDATGRASVFAVRAVKLRQSIAQGRAPTDCAWAGVEMADIASMYEAVGLMAEAA